MTAKGGGVQSKPQERVLNMSNTRWTGMLSAREKLCAAEQALRPWVIRHRRPQELTGEFKGRPRRLRLPGRSMVDQHGASIETGLEVSEDALLPFLLAARAAVCMAESRPVFAEGLASSYEAFRYTRRRNAGIDADAEPLESVAPSSLKS